MTLDGPAVPGTTILVVVLVLLLVLLVAHHQPRNLPGTLEDPRGTRVPGYPPQSSQWSSGERVEIQGRSQTQVKFKSTVRTPIEAHRLGIH
eukprot:3937146-Rhodomonas_salina.1